MHGAYNVKFTNVSDNFVTDHRLLNAIWNFIKLQGLVGLHMLYNI